jgi:hypothetical protein
MPKTMSKPRSCTTAAIHGASRNCCKTQLRHISHKGQDQGRTQRCSRALQHSATQLSQAVIILLALWTFCCLRGRWSSSLVIREAPKENTGSPGQLRKTQPCSKHGRARYSPTKQPHKPVKDSGGSFKTTMAGHPQSMSKAKSLPLSQLQHTFSTSSPTRTGLGMGWNNATGPSLRPPRRGKAQAPEEPDHPSRSTGNQAVPIEPQQKPWSPPTAPGTRGTTKGCQFHAADAWLSWHGQAE